MEVWIDIC